MEVMDDGFYMDLALEMAARTTGQTSVNPVVGCVVVNNGRIVGIGAHLKRGEGHAEVHALNMAGEEAEGSTVYVTLEPCSHFGRTPPCCDRIIAARAAKVVIAAIDPNPAVAGSGARKLREAGIEVVAGVREAESRRLNEAFNKFITTGLPFVTLKTASTLDGKIAAKSGDSRWITGPESREAVHALRHRHQGIMVGIGTVLADDPSLSARLPVPAIQPVRIVVDSTLRLPPNAKLMDGSAPVIVLASGAADPAKRAALEAAGAEVILCGNGRTVDLKQGMKLLGKREIGSILLEGGGRLNGAMLERRLVDRIRLFFAPKIIGGGAASPGSFDFGGFLRMEEAITLADTELERFGDDWCLSGVPLYERGGG
ncbi:5-amino-6-(5-phosphoribosylamino)uracil reductase [Paenibacillus sp. D9]|uniref:bifunctional diaminohydroxyphosphoribosylaminopyrimidine deaminase/5-amino-6-(5-phosphoribosylamino)uracil reductase RibD n=1 Tax=Paenibacillus sp. D9 TaxID=665792 RepID=UPI00061F51E3|nr:bifunctional diaminohydroxyphosphoribosylaminopyrimidine deaminase/5-amino-6-(5-phosphoribosylamino)uracil reductase RibD [Paenibacillus sp. D9]KKC46215.1 5-amino-6-(5-phosphoribosylamino)uracil reductase [Paenibacillus sp. D9]